MVAVLGPTATGKSSLGIRLAQTYDGEIVNCDSTAVYRRFDIGTDKVPAHEQGGIAHHLVDVVEPTDIYSAAQFARDAATRIREISARGRLPMLVGGTGFYFRALVEGLFDGPGRDDTVRTRLHARAVQHGVEHLHRILARVDPASAARIMPRDEKRLVRALEVWLLTGQPLSAHFAETRALIVRENRQYARRQLIWFRKEPRVIWLDGPGERDETFDAARALIETHGVCR